MLQRLTGRAAVLIVTASQLTSGFAQDSQSHLVLFSPLTNEKNVSLVVKNIDGKVLNSAIWYSGLPFYGDFILPQAEYKINIPSPVSSITIRTDEKTRTFLQVTRYAGAKGEQGVQITVWRGQPNEAIQKALSEFKNAGIKDTEEPIPLGDVRAKVLDINTEPPWPTPFDPKPQPFPPPK